MGMGGQRHASAAFTPRKEPVPIVQEGGWARGTVWTGAENLAPYRDLFKAVGFTCNEF